MKKILVVDDERDIQRLFLQKFRREIKAGTFTFVFAFSGQEALDILGGMLQEAVLILSDINMPGMSGIELLAAIKREIHEPPPIVMMITAYGDEETYRQAKELGADDFLTKPVDFVALKAKLNLLP